MKEYFTLDESLAYLNKDLDIVERISLRDLLSYASELKLIPCFYYFGEVIYSDENEENEDFFRMKGYLDFNFKDYLTHPSLGKYLLQNFLLKQNYFFINSDENFDCFRTYDPYIQDNNLTIYILGNHQKKILENDYQTYDKIEFDYEDLSTFILNPNANISISFSDVFFHKKELLKLKKSDDFNNDLIPILKNKITELENTVQKLSLQNQIEKELPTRTANNVSKIISALCELQKLDITKPYGEASQTIRAKLDELACPLSKEVVADWLKLAHKNTK